MIYSEFYCCCQIYVLLDTCAMSFCQNIYLIYCSTRSLLVPNFGNYVMVKVELERARCRQDSVLRTVSTAVTSHAQMPSRDGPQLGKSDGGSTTKLSLKRFRKYHIMTRYGRTRRLETFTKQFFSFSPAKIQTFPQPHCLWAEHHLTLSQSELQTSSLWRLMAICRGRSFVIKIYRSFRWHIF